MALQKLLVALALLALSAAGWGPATHYYMTCAALRPHSLIDCLMQHRHLLSGTEMPDAFFFGDFVDGSPCVGVGELHSLVYAGYLVKQAISERDAANLEIALGFGAHVAGDLAGFWPGGYLGSGNETQPDLYNWVALWPFMTAVDAWVAQVELPAKLRVTSVQQPLDIPTLDANASLFMERARNRMAKDFPTETPNATAGLISTCSAVWQQVVTTENLKAQVLPPAVFGFELVYNDRYGAANATAAAANIRLALECGIDTIGAWRDAILNTTISPLTASDAAMARISNLFAQGLCRPT